MEQKKFVKEEFPVKKINKKDMIPSLDPSLEHGVDDAMPVLLDCPHHGPNRWAAADPKGMFVCSDCEPNRPRLTAADLRE